LNLNAEAGYAAALDPLVPLLNGLESLTWLIDKSLLQQNTDVGGKPGFVVAAR
jgi:hypothetical protein